MVKLPENPQKLMDQWFPRGFGYREEAQSLVDLALRGPLPGDGPIDKLHEAKRITKAEKEQVIRFAYRRLESLLLMREKEPERYRRTVIANALVRREQGWS